MMDRLVTSPMFVAHVGPSGLAGIDLRNGNRFRLDNPRSLHLLALAASGRTRKELEGFGYGDDEVAEALDAGLLVDTDQHQMLDLWERHGWMEAAFLMFSQRDIEYQEIAEGAHSPETYIASRRRILAAQLGEEPYPAPYLQKVDAVISLPAVPSRGQRVDLERLFSRRSVRSFSTTSMSRDDISHVLWHATHFCRLAETNRKVADPVALVTNSFYSWLVIYVIVRRVDGLGIGIYQYDPLRHELRLVRGERMDAEVQQAMSGQPWATAGCVSVVICADWRRYMWPYRHSRGYINLWIQAGEFCQELLHSMTLRGCSGWMSPALSESRMRSLLGIQDSFVDPLYFLHMGYPNG